MLEILERAPSPKLMVTLKRADHLHFMDNAEEVHESFRTSNLGVRYAEIQRDVKPAAQLVSGATAHAFASGLSVAHFDAILRRRSSARRFLEVDLKRVVMNQKLLGLYGLGVMDVTDRLLLRLPDRGLLGPIGPWRPLGAQSTLARPSARWDPRGLGEWFREFRDSDSRGVAGARDLHPLKRPHGNSLNQRDDYFDVRGCLKYLKSGGA
jgi:hypothetical protein